MDIRHMQCFVAVARAGSFSKAADALFVSRQAVAKAVAKLEDETGLRLFDADHRGVRLTSDGAAFLEEVAPLLEAYARIEQKYGGPHAAPVLEIALGKGTIRPFSSDFIPRFGELNPHIDIHVEEIHSVGVLRMVEEGDAEVGLLCTHPKYLAGFETIDLAHPGYSVSVPFDNPLAAKERMDLVDLDGVSFVTLGDRNHLHRFFLEQCERAGVRPQFVASMSDAGMLEQAQLRASALAFVCTPGFDQPCENVACVPLDMEDSDKFGPHVIKRPGTALSAPARAFWDYAAEHARAGR